MIATPTTTPITGPRVLSVTVTEAPVLTSTGAASLLSEGSGLESATVSSVGVPTQSEIGSANELATATGRGGLAAPFISVGTETSSVVTESNTVAGEGGVSTEVPTVTSTLISSVFGENTKALLSLAITTQGQERVSERSTGIEQILASGNENAFVFEIGRTNVQPNLASGVGAVALFDVSAAVETLSSTLLGDVFASELGNVTEQPTSRAAGTTSMLNEVLSVLVASSLTGVGGGIVSELASTSESALFTSPASQNVIEKGVGVENGIVLGSALFVATEYGTASERGNATGVGQSTAKTKGQALESVTAQGETLASLVKIILAISSKINLKANTNENVYERGQTREKIFVVENADTLSGEFGLVQARPVLEFVSKVSSLPVYTAARENALASALKDGLVKEFTQAFENANVDGIGKLNINNPLLRISPQIRLIATEGGNVLERGSTTETSVLSGISLSSTTESGQAISQPLLTGTVSTGSNESGIGHEVSSLIENTSLGATELALLKSVLAFAAKSQENVKELGTTFEFTTLNNNSIPKLTDEGRTVSSAFLKAKSDAFSVEAALAPESLSSSSNLRSAFAETGQATELPSAFANGLLNAGETAQANEQGHTLGRSDTFIIEIGDAVASLLRVRLNGDGDASFAEIGRTGEAAVLRGTGNLNAVTTGKKFVATLLKAGTSESVTESGVVVPQVTATARSKTTSILPTLLANEGAVLNAIAQTSFSESVPQRIAEIQAVLKDTMGINASMTDAIVIDTIIRD